MLRRGIRVAECLEIGFDRRFWASKPSDRLPSDETGFGASFQAFPGSSGLFAELLGFGANKRAKQ
jgi:hypothetical protein